MSSCRSIGNQSFSYKEGLPAQQSYQPDGKMTTTSSSKKDRSKPLLGRSSTFEEENVQADIENYQKPLSQSDYGALVSGWQSTRQAVNQHVPQSVPNGRNLAFHRPAEESTSGSGCRDGRKQVSRIKPLLRAETIAHGLGNHNPVQRVPECNICMEDFKEEGSRVPRFLTCGHSYCTGEACT